MRARLSIAAALALAACHRHARRAGEEWVRSVQVEGYRAKSDGDLEAGLALHRSEQEERPLDP